MPYDHQQLPTAAEPTTNEITRQRAVAGLDLSRGERRDRSSGHGDSGSDPARGGGYPHSFMLRDRLNQSDEERAVRSLIRAKLRIGDAGDQFEQEADRVAEQVVTRQSRGTVSGNSGSGSSGSGGASGGSQRQPSISRMPLATTSLWAAARTSSEREHSGDGARTERATESARPSMVDVATRAIDGSGEGSPMHPATRGTLESSLGTDLSQVRVHDDRTAQRSASDLGARAFTHRNHIWLGPGESQSDLSLMAHETAHVLQQDGVVRRKPDPTKEDQNEEEKKRKIEQGAPTGAETTEGAADGSVTPTSTSRDGAAMPTSTATTTPVPTSAASENTAAPEGEAATAESETASGNDGARAMAPDGASGAPEPMPTASAGVGENGGNHEKEIDSPVLTRTVGAVTSDVQHVEGTAPAGAPPTVAEKVSEAGDAAAARASTGPESASGASVDIQAASLTDASEEAGATKEAVALEGAEVAGEAGGAAMEMAASVEGEGPAEEGAEAPEQIMTGPGTPSVTAGAPAGEAAQAPPPGSLAAIGASATQLLSTGVHFGGETSKDSRTGDNPAAEANAKSTEFLARGVTRVQSIVAAGESVSGEITAAATAAKAGVDASMSENTSKLQASIAGARGEATKKATQTRGTVDRNHTRAISSVNSSTTAARGRAQSMHQAAMRALATQESAQLGRVQSHFATGYQTFRGLGPVVGNRAIAKGEQRARGYISQFNGESTLLEGAYHDNKLQASADAARAVAKEYQKGIIAEADKQAGNLLQGKPQAIAKVRESAGKTRDVLNAQLKTANDSLDKAKMSSIAGANAMKKKLIKAIDKGLKSTLAKLAEQESAQLSGLKAYGEGQKSAIDRDTALVIASLVQGVAQSAGSLNDTLASFVAGARGAEAPAPEELDAILGDADATIGEVVAQVLAKIQEGIQTSNQGIAGGGATLVDSLNTLGIAGIDQATKAQAAFDGGLTELLGVANQIFSDLSKTHQRTMNASTKSIGKGFDEVTKGITELFTTIDKNLSQGFTDSAKGLEKGLNGVLTKLDAKISEEAKKAADQVQPRWKSVLKVLLVIVVLIVVAVLVGPAVIAFAGAAAGTLGTIIGGAIVGAAAGATIQLGNNLIDGNKNIFEGVGKAAAVGAISGLAGGLGAAASGAVGSTLGTVGQALVRGGINLAFDVGGSIIGDLAVGNPITLEGVLIGAGIGLVAGGAFNNLGKLGKIGRALESVQIASEGLGASAGTAFGGGVKSGLGFVKPEVPASEPTIKPGTVESPTLPKPEVEAPEMPGVNRVAPEPTTSGGKLEIEPPSARTKGASEIETPAGGPKGEFEPTVRAPKTEAEPTATGSGHAEGEGKPAGVKPEEEIPSGAQRNGDAPKRSTHANEPEIEPGVVAKEKVTGPDGEHQIKVLKNGKVVKCSECADLRARYADELADPNNAHLKERLDALEGVADPKVKARLAAELDGELGAVKTGRLGAGMDVETGPVTNTPTINGRKPINSEYAGKTHPSGVKFTEQGFPDFRPHAKAEVELDNLTGHYPTDAARANQAVGLSKTPDDYVWHHVEDGRTLQLIPKKIHRAARHTGGAAIIRNGGFD